MTEETYEAETDLRSEIETAIERAASGVHDSTQWWDNWNKDKQGRRIIEQVVDSIVSAAKDYAKGYRQ